MILSMSARCAANFFQIISLPYIEMEWSTAIIKNKYSTFGILLSFCYLSFKYCPLAKETAKETKSKTPDTNTDSIASLNPDNSQMYKYGIGNAATISQKPNFCLFDNFFTSLFFFNSLRISSHNCFCSELSLLSFLTSLISSKFNFKLLQFGLIFLNK